MSTQRYVSNELTHFVGRGMGVDEQYDLLMDQILKPGWLTFPPHDRSPFRSPSLDLGTTISDGKMIGHRVICFCDIPLADLSIHMKKYSNFGISFRREFLIRHGASPAFYVANNSTVAASGLIPLDYLTDRINDALSNGIIERGLYFDDYIKIILDLMWIFDALASDYQGDWFKASGTRESNRATMINVMNTLFAFQESELDQFVATQGAREHFGRSVRLIGEFILVGIFDFIKCFDASKAEDDPDNYYMEREWRLPKNLKFDLKDVERIIMPRKFATAFRADLPGYNAQLHFVD
jgi:hypothetical protein